jgi:HemY protein
VGAALAERQLWGKAREPLEAAAKHPDLPITSRRMAWLTLAQLAQSEGHPERMAECHRQAAILG